MANRYNHRQQTSINNVIIRVILMEGWTLPPETHHNTSIDHLNIRVFLEEAMPQVLAAACPPYAYFILRAKAQSTFQFSRYCLTPNHLSIAMLFQCATASQTKLTRVIRPDQTSIHSFISLTKPHLIPPTNPFSKRTY